MKDGSWLEALDHELAIRGLSATERAEALVEVESHLDDAGVAALEHFGPPATYADAVARASGLDPDRGHVRQQGRPGSNGWLLEAKEVTRHYRRRPVLAPITLQVGPGQVVALIGANGAGKSTLLRLLAGLEAPDSGTIHRRASVGYVPQTGGLDPYLRPRQHVELFGAARGLTLAILIALPIAFYLASHDLVGRSVRSLAFGISWAVSTVAFFAAASARELEPRLLLSGRTRAELVTARLAALCALALAVGAGFWLMVILDQPAVGPGGVAIDFGVTAVTAVAFGSAIGALVAREMEGVLVLFFFAGLQAVVDPFEQWTRLLPFWSSRQLGTWAVDGPRQASLWSGLGQAGIMVAVCLAVLAARGMVGRPRAKTRGAATNRAR